MDSITLLAVRHAGAASVASGITLSTTITSFNTDIHSDDDEGGSFFDLEFPLLCESPSSEQIPKSSPSSSGDTPSDFTVAGDPVTFAFSADPKPLPFPGYLIKSATKLRVLMLALAKSKSNATEPQAGTSAADSAAKSSNFFIRLRIMEVAISREAVMRYVSKIKPFYVKVSRRSAEKKRFSGQLVPVGRSKPAVVAAPPPRTRDDSRRQQDDGIESAIAHCKRFLEPLRTNTARKVKF